MSSFSGAIKAIILGMLLLMAPKWFPTPSPFSAKQDRSGFTVIAKSEVAPND